MTFLGEFGYTDDIVLVAPSIYSPKEMVKHFEHFAHEYHICFNSSKFNLRSFDLKQTTWHQHFPERQKVEVVDNDSDLGNYVASDLKDINLIKHVCDFYERNNKVICDFNACDSVTLDALHQIYCMHMYGCEL